MKECKKRCVVCSKRLKIIIKDKKGHYTGGHYFSVLQLHSKYRSIGRYVKIGNMKFGIVEGIGKPKEIEYWECDKCYKE